MRRRRLYFWLSFGRFSVCSGRLPMHLLTIPLWSHSFACIARRPHDKKLALVSPPLSGLGCTNDFTDTNTRRQSFFTSVAQAQSSASHNLCGVVYDDSTFFVPLDSTQTAQIRKTEPSKTEPITAILVCVAGRLCGERTHKMLGANGGTVWFDANLCHDWRFDRNSCCAYSGTERCE